MGRIGRLRQRGRLQRRTTTRDGEGGSSESWATYATIWCSVTPHDGEERLSEQRTTALVKHRVETRWVDGVHPSDRLVLRTRKGADRVLSISAVLNTMERAERLVMMCTEVLDPLPEAAS